VSQFALLPSGEGAARNTRGRVCSPIPTASLRLNGQWNSQERPCIGNNLRYH
jgi:hypothetical protein